jgi:exonuclease SbcC
MRPVRLELHGFASFRDPVVIDFADADLFVLFGPTGAGKSSVIDAITFALYGSIPRYDDRRLVAPAISQGANEAKVRLDFRAGDELFTAVRVVRRTKDGATTKEARLVRADGETIAGNADELTREAERLIGLPFEHFTRCVVLPQGDFAQFLHARPADRQDLLVRLLGLEVYRRIARAANLRAGASTNSALLLKQRLEQELCNATAEALHEAGTRAAALEQLRDRLRADRPELQKLVDEHARESAAASDAESRVHALAAIAIPDAVAALATRIEAAASELAAARADLLRLEEQRARAEESRAAHPERALLEGIRDQHRRHADLTSRIEKATLLLKDAGAAAEQARTAAEQAVVVVNAAERMLQQLQRARAALHLAEQLAPGMTCPVCLQPVKKLPHHDVPADLEEARKASTIATAGRDRATDALRDAEWKHVRARTETESLQEQVAHLDEQLDGRPAPEEVEQALHTVALLEAALADARKAEAAARERVTRADHAVQKLAGERDRARSRLDAVRDGLLARGLAPPPLAQEDLREAWSTLISWAAEAVAGERERAETHRTAAEAAAQRAQERVQEQRAACSALGVEAGQGDPYETCTHAAAAARANAERIAKDIETAARVREELTRAERAAATAKELGRLLDARNFERWLMRRALTTLVNGASTRLLQLSGAAYSLGLDSRNEFLVIDHRNADEPRSARSLSGGETFLASLALALSLAEHVAEMAGGGTRLDALFLDEGFGTLDAETLDVVASAIEELGARGRMVGLVTHVRDLAERVPVRYEVRKIGTTSTIERVA